MTPEEWLQKADWEGGLAEAILDYGLDESDLDKEADPYLWEAVKHFREVAAPALEALGAAASRYEVEPL